MNTKNSTCVFMQRLFILILFMAGIPSKGQTIFKQVGESYMTIAGTSTLHDWTMTSLEPQLQATFETTSEGTIKKLNSLSLDVMSESLKSPHKAMDKNAYASLKTDKHKTISFMLTSATINKNQIQCVGNLSIAGVTKQIGIDAVCQTLPDGTMSLQCTGSKAIKMSDYQVVAPSFMFGTVKTGDDIKISFNVIMAPDKK